MKENAFETIRLMPRDELETFAVRAALQLRNDRWAVESENAFLTILIGFLLGAIVAASGFLLGAGLS
jgi:hypothetical protein